MSNNEEMVFDVIVNGKKAKVELDKLKKSTDELGDKTEEVDSKTKSATSSIKAGWIAVGASVAASIAVMGKAIAQASELSKATFGMSDAMKAYVLEVSNASGIQQEMIAGFVKTGETAGMSSVEIKKMVSQAIALGRAFPHESTESFIDNLTMLNTTGEAQGYIVDVLEQKWGTIDLKGKTLAEKMEVIDEATKGVNEQFSNVAGQKMDTLFTKAANALTELGRVALNMINNWGWLDAVNESFDRLLLKFKEVSEYSQKEVTSEISRTEAELAKLNKTLADGGNWYDAGDVALKNRIRQTKLHLASLKNQEKQIVKTAKIEKEASEKIIAQRQKELDKQKKIEAEKVEAAKKTAEGIKDAKRSEVQAVTEAEREKQRIEQQTAFIHGNIIGMMTDSLVDFVMTGKAHFSDLVQSIIAYILQMRVAAMLQSFMGGSGGVLSFLGIHTGSNKVLHTGGMVGIPSHHSGSMRSDERVAKLQVGEAVINRAGTAKNQEAIKAMNAGAKVGGGAVQQTKAEINFNVTAIDAASFNSYLVNNKQTIEGIINNSLVRNGSVRQTIKQVV